VELYLARRICSWPFKGDRKTSDEVRQKGKGINAKSSSSKGRGSCQVAKANGNSKF